ncbi:DUF6252 family protein [uncultured Flavobacterium sp.]|uniref:DUF6252 family protein n=1 Tax=uncultured Flavobacterium sp. TaxID=165435 RepID=UPI0030CA552A
MIKLITAALILFTFFSCTDDAAFNDPSFQGIKDGETWRANDAKVTINTDGSMIVEATTNYEVVKFEILSSDIGTHTFGIDASNLASYKITLNGSTESYTTGVNFGGGALQITESPSETGKLSGKFTLRGVNLEGMEAVFTYGVIYNIPVQ